MVGEYCAFPPKLVRQIMSDSNQFVKDDKAVNIKYVQSDKAFNDEVAQADKNELLVVVFLAKKYDESHPEKNPLTMLLPFFAHFATAVNAKDKFKIVILNACDPANKETASKYQVENIQSQAFALIKNSEMLFKSHELHQVIQHASHRIPINQAAKNNNDVDLDVKFVHGKTAFNEEIDQASKKDELLVIGFLLNHHDAKASNQDPLTKSLPFLAHFAKALSATGTFRFVLVNIKDDADIQEIAKGYGIEGVESQVFALVKNNKMIFKTPQLHEIQQQSAA
jgi:hypothetical protein